MSDAEVEEDFHRILTLIDREGSAPLAKGNEAAGRSCAKGLLQSAQKRYGARYMLGSLTEILDGWHGRRRIGDR